MVQKILLWSSGAQLRALILILFFTLLTPYILNASPSVDVPARHWSYDAVEKLAIIGLCDTADIGIRPVSRIKMAYMVKTAIDKARDYDKEFDWNEQDYLEALLNKLIEEFRVELVTIGVEVASTSDLDPKKNQFKILDGIKIEKLYARLDKDRLLFENKDGWILKDGFNARIKATAWAKLSNICAVSVTPGIRYSSEDTDINIEDAHVRLNPTGWNTEYSIGRSSMWWGPGFHGSVLMTDNAFPMDTLRINNIWPFRLPWVFKKMGRFSGTWFISRLEKKFNPSHPIFTGWKLDFIPAEFLKFGVGHILMFGGKGVNMYGIHDFIGNSSLFFSSGGGENDPENHIMSWDAQLFLRRID
ncbi:MAG: capsule assembly Wzi family protein, partial [Candidatus Omnitrophota bacterium]|nr:capsule assembly Wzi family protein [Candidatus Omnitrophota bacterium]